MAILLLFFQSCRYEQFSTHSIYHKNMAAPIVIQTDALLGQTSEMLYGQAENIEPYIAQHQQAATQAPQYRPQNVQTLETSHVQYHHCSGKHLVSSGAGQGNRSVNTTNQPA